MKEIYQLEKKSVFETVNWKQLSLQERKKLVGTRMFLKKKYKADGSFEKRKSHLVAQVKHLVHSDRPASPTAVIHPFFSWRDWQRGSGELWLRWTSLDFTSTLP